MVRILSFLLILFVFISTWFLGGHLFHKQWWILENLFGNSNWENTFSPVNAFFAALASCGAIYAIILQTLQFRSQQFENNFINLLNIHKSNKETLKTDVGENHLIGNEVFYELYQLLKEIYFRAIDPDSTQSCFKPKNNIDDLINARLDGLRNDYGVIEKNNKELFKVCHKTFDESIDYSLSQYFRHLYHLVKFVDQAPGWSRKQFIGILRAQFDNYEYALLYYNTLMHDDKKRFDKKSKFQVLIEKYCLLHNIQHRLLFDNGKAGRYSDCAFLHLEERCLEGLKIKTNLLAKRIKPFIENFNECLNPKFDK